MKKLLFSLLALVGLSAFSHADIQGVYKSSFTQTDESLALVAPTTGTPLSLHGIIVSSASAAGGLLTVYDSSRTATSPIARIGLTTVGAYYFDVKISSGLTYTTATNTQGVTILYQPR
jgi:hypothetical protein